MIADLLDAALNRLREREDQYCSLYARHEEALQQISECQSLIEEMMSVKNRWEAELLSVYDAIDAVPGVGYEDCAQRVRAHLAGRTHDGRGDF
jgi:hypothetical protein